LRLCEVLCLWPPSGAYTAGPHSAAQDPAVEAALHHIERHTDRLVPLTELAEVAHLSPRHFSRRFLSACGVTPHEYAAGLRLRLAQDWLHEGALSVSQVATALGFSSVQGFSRWFKTRTGAAPRSWQGGRPLGVQNG